VVQVLEQPSRGDKWVHGGSLAKSDLPWGAV
jgi:hypothetical protein